MFKKSLILFSIFLMLTACSKEANKKENNAMTINFIDAPIRQTCDNLLCPIIPKNDMPQLKENEISLYDLLQDEIKGYHIESFTYGHDHRIDFYNDEILFSYLKHIPLGKEKTILKTKVQGVSFSTVLYLSNELGEDIKIIEDHDGYSLYHNGDLLAQYEVNTNSSFNLNNIFAYFNDPVSIYMTAFNIRMHRNNYGIYTYNRKLTDNGFSLDEIQNSLKEANIDYKQYQIYDNNNLVDDLPTGKGEHAISLYSTCTIIEFYYVIE